MLAIGRALVTQPRLLLLDEPTLGLSPLLAREMIAVVGNLRNNGISVLLVEQNAALALTVADRVYALTTGTISHSGSVTDADLIADIRHAYLGRETN